MKRDFLSKHRILIGCLLYLACLTIFALIIVQTIPLEALDLAPYHPAPPSETLWLGSTSTGQNLLVLLSHGFLSSLLFLSVMVPAIYSVALSLGILFSATPFLRRWLPLERIIEILNSIPIVLLLVILSYHHILNFWIFIGLILFFKWPYTAQMAYGVYQELQKKSYIHQAYALGFARFKIFQIYVFPKVVSALAAQIPVLAINLFNTLLVLDFIGYNEMNSVASLGQLIAEGKDHLYAPWILITSLSILSIILFPFVALALSLKDLNKRLDSEADSQ